MEAATPARAAQAWPGLFVEAAPRRRALGTLVLLCERRVPPRAYSQLAGLWGADGWAVFVPRLRGAYVEAATAALQFAVESLPRPVLLAGHGYGGGAAISVALRLVAASRAGVDDSCTRRALCGLLLLDPVAVSGRCGRDVDTELLGDGARSQNWTWDGLPVLTIAALMSRGGLLRLARSESDYRAIQSCFAAATMVSGTGRTHGRVGYDQEAFYVSELEEYGRFDFLNDAGVSSGVVPAVATCFVGGTKTGRAPLREFCKTATRLVFGPGRKDNLPSRLASVEPL